MVRFIEEGFKSFTDLLLDTPVNSCALTMRDTNVLTEYRDHSDLSVLNLRIYEIVGMSNITNI